MNAHGVSVKKYVADNLEFQFDEVDNQVKESASARFETAFLLLPGDVLEMFLSGSRRLKIRIAPNPALPMGMATSSEGDSTGGGYIITSYPEHLEWDERRFIGAFLRELGHVVLNRPPEVQWPTDRLERSQFKEELECKADAVVWKWGLMSYNVDYLYHTYPTHWAERIIGSIEELLENR
jgi:hypothetical protein